VAELLAQAARHRFGAHLRPGDFEEVRKTIADGLRAGERLRRVKLTNADEPVTTFSPLPPGVRPPAPRPAARPAPRRRRGRSGRTT
jgi:hypothetical protein